MHRVVGRFAADCGIDVLLCHGTDACHIYDGFASAGANVVGRADRVGRADVTSRTDEAGKAGVTDSADGADVVRFYPEMDDLIKDIPQIIQKGDAVLVKASHGMRFEKLLPVVSSYASHYFSSCGM
jgi:hypothetical protein